MTQLELLPSLAPTGCRLAYTCPACHKPGATTWPAPTPPALTWCTCQHCHQPIRLEEPQ